MTIEPETLLWTQPAWRDEAENWLRSELEQRGVRVVGPLAQPHIRPWSTILRAPTSAGPVYFKAVAAPLIQEAALTAWLAHRRPDCTPTLLGADPARGWLILAEGGPRLRDAFKADPDVSRWEEILQRYAGLQIELASERAALLGLGVLDRGDAAFYRLYEDLIADRLAYGGGPEYRLTPAEHERLANLAPAAAAEYAALAGYAVPLSLNHGDFHDGNIFLGPSGAVFFDWGDASLSHPFFSLRTVWVSLENTFDLTPGAPEFARLQAAYLESWQRFEPRARLEEVVARAARLAPILTALAWQRALSAAPAAFQADYDYAVPRLLREFLEGFDYHA